MGLANNKSDTFSPLYRIDFWKSLPFTLNRQKYTFVPEAQKSKGSLCVN